ncbi:glycosyltransferase [Aliishimia ponticola]|uniref:Glycosyltransferase n=1 Tax=Aliishimia ponticola TaxID=2499833 RepID=A0A4V3XK07_9RHOB|nr:glycosyltransferase [Aliishimia ponticola]THH35113.1 glycosyltransferase [Aliishimia ponticola]
MTARVLIVVTHLLGTGHLARALALGRAFSAAGHEAHVISGGFPAPHLNAQYVHLHQLPPLRSDGTDFTRLLGEADVLADDDYLAQRRHALLDLWRTLAPDILITELFPFGRRNLRAEFIELLDAAKNSASSPRVFASIRDVLAPPSKPTKAAFAEDIVRRFYDGVLVHSDRALVPLDESWPVTPELAAVLRYTGFVVPPLPLLTGQAGQGEILVSAGGGAVGGALFSAALTAAQGDERTWRILVGGQQSQDRIARLAAHAPHNVIVEAARPDFREMMQRASASVSMCGYNTAMDLLQTGIPAVITPFDDGGEVEQSLRARALARLDGIELVPSDALNGSALLHALDRAMAAPLRRRAAFRLDGAREAVRICTEALE